MSTKPRITTKGREVYFALNKHFKTAAHITGLQSFEELQCLFRWGIILPDGHEADGIGRCASEAELESRAKNGGFTLYNSHNANPFVRGQP